MTFYKFTENDSFYNVLTTHPNINFKIYDQKVYYNNNTEIIGQNTSNATHVPVGHLSAYEINIDRPAGQLAYPFITKAGNLMAFKTVSTSSFNTDFQYGDTITGSYPLSASISSQRFAFNSSRKQINSLKNTLNNYQPLSLHFGYNTILGDKSTQELRLIDVPSIFYGTQINPGHTTLKIYVTGTLIAELNDDKKRGELKQRLPQDANSGSVAGQVLYKHGLIVLTGSWDLHASHTENYTGAGAASPRWIDFATTGSTTAGTNVPNTSFELDFEGTQKIPVMTLLMHAPKGELNHSNNPTFIKFNQTGSREPLTGSFTYDETELELANTIKTTFIEPTSSFSKQTFISSVGIYDDEKNLLGVVKLATPIRKKEQDSYTIKAKIDF